MKPTNSKNEQRHLFTAVKSIVLMTVAVVSLSITVRGNFAAEANQSRNLNIKTGLLILSHGSPSDRWNDRVKTLVARIQKENESRHCFHAIETAFLEFAKPDAKDGIDRLEVAGCQRIVVVPAFIFPTGHSHFDVPSVLGIYTSPSIRKMLKEEKARVASPKVPIVVTQTLSEGDLLRHYVQDEVKALSKDPKRESLIVFAHGDPGHEGLISPTMKQITENAAKSNGIQDCTWCYCEMGQQLHADIAPSMKKMSAKGQTVLVVGVYLASSADSIFQAVERAERAKVANKKPIGHNNEKSEGVTSSSPRRFKGIPIVLSKKNLSEHPKTANFIYETAVSAIE